MLCPYNVPGKVIIGCDDFRFEVLGKRRREDLLANLKAATAEVSDVAGIEASKDLHDFLVELRFAEEVAIGLGGDREAVRDADPFLRERPDHLAERGVLPSDQRNIADSDLIEPFNVAVFLYWSRHRLLLTIFEIALCDRLSEAYFSCAASLCRTTKIGQGASRATRSATLPIIMCENPFRPWVPRTMRSAPISFAVRTISREGTPSLKSDSIGRPSFRPDPPARSAFLFPLA